MKKRSNQEGTIFQRKDGTWEGQLSVGFARDGTRKRISLYGHTKDSVEKKLWEARPSVGLRVNKDTITVGDYLTIWLDDAYKRDQIRNTTHALWERTIRRHVVRVIGAAKLADLTPEKMVLFFARRKQQTTYWVYRTVYMVLHRAFGQALKWGNVDRDLFAHVQAPQEPKPKVNVYDDDQILKFLLAARGDRFEAVFYLAFFGGLRKSEIFGLKWGDINFDAKLVSLQRGLVSLDGKLVINPLKTRTSRRAILMPDFVIEVLRRHRDLMIAEGHTEYVFVSKTGTFVNPGNFHFRHFGPILKKADLPHIRFHDIRHCCATLCLNLNIHPKVVQERLGHSTISQVMNTYTHVIETTQEATRETMNKFFEQLANSADTGDEAQ